MKKYLVALAILSLVIFASGCASQEKNYDANGISFNYPTTWNVTSTTSAANMTMVLVTDPDFTNTNGTKGTTVIVFKIPKNTSSNINQVMHKTVQNVTQPGETASAIKEVTFNGINANETTFTRKNSDGAQIQSKVIYFERNNKLCIMMLSTVSSDFDAQKKNFELILNSFEFE